MPELVWKEEYYYLKEYDIDKDKRFQLRLRCSIHPKDPEHRVFIRAFDIMDNKNKCVLDAFYPEKKKSILSFNV